MTTTPTLNNSHRINTDIVIQKFTAPLPKNLADHIESFLVRIFEYGNYSFRTALRGQMDPLCVTTLVALRHQHIVGVSMGLSPPSQQGIALLGPVAVNQQFRQQGIATSLIQRLCDHFSTQNITTIFLAAKFNHPARSLYHKLGFQNDQGIVMRRSSSNSHFFDKQYFSFSPTVKVRKANWSDYCGVQLLLITPATMICFDYQRGLFSSRVSSPTRFFSVFPDLMKQQQQGYGFTNVLVSAAQEKVMGLAHISRLPAAPSHHLATLDFFVHDSFVHHAMQLLATTIKQARQMGAKRIVCYVPRVDTLKQNVLNDLGINVAAILPEQISLQNQFHDILVYCG